MNEAAVVQRVHTFLSTQGIEGVRTSRLFTDPHPTLIGFPSLKPFQRFSLDFDDFAVHPDLLGQETGSESLIAVEAKGGNDLLKGLAQAEIYQHGVQRSFLAAPAAALSDTLVNMARAKEVGILSVQESVQAIYVPQARRPFNRFYNALLADLTSAAYVNESGTFVYNLPTHYLVWATALRPGSGYTLTEARTRLGPFPIPGDGRYALRGAQKLGLLRIDGHQARLTDIGAAVRDLLPATLLDWTDIHRRLTSPGSRTTLHDEHRSAAAALKLLLLQDALVRLVMEGLHLGDPAGSSFDQLAAACGTIDPRRTAIFFLKPQAAARWVGRDGRVNWHEVPGEDYRSTTFFQHKSVLKHAGLIAAGALGGASAKHYDPRKDFWALRPTPPPPP
ncbi:MAG: hypothetical protein RLZZ584_4265 [Pseudomonadota bacterium]|jgi:hypothetical protein